MRTMTFIDEVNLKFECLYKYQIIRKQTLYGDEFSEYICRCDCHKGVKND